MHQKRPSEIIIEFTSFMIEYRMEGCTLTCICIMNVPLHPLDVSKLDYTRFIHNDNKHKFKPRLVGSMKMTTF